MSRSTGSSARTLKKIVARLEEGAWHGYATETVWAEQVDASRYRLRSVPFYARGLSIEDIVTTRREDDIDLITGVSLHGGHSTYRIFLAADVPLESTTFEEQWALLAKMGCTFERATERLLAVDVPPAADLHTTYDLLAHGESAGIWDFEEGSVSPNASGPKPTT